MYSTIIPYAAFTNFTPALPEFYWNVYSAEQRIKHICYEIGKLAEYSNMLCSSINDLAQYTDEKLDEFDRKTQLQMQELKRQVEEELNDLRDELLRILETLEIGALQWDCQTGEFQDTVTAQRDMFNDVTIHSYTVGQLESVFDSMGYTVDDLANCGLNVKGYALLSHYIDGSETFTEDFLSSNGYLYVI